MQRKLFYPLLIFVGVFFVLAVGIWLTMATPVKAQCGSQASSCKNCHEVQGQKSVNNDGTAWHTSHAFGDFCYICHGGNNQSTDETEAHKGMVPPLSDIQASCIQCHPTDLQERAQVFASVLGVEIGANETAPSNPASDAENTNTNSVEGVSVPATTELDIDDPNLVDYEKNYNEIVLGKKPINWGNMILIALIGIIAVGGGGFVVTREKLVKISFGETKTASDEYPAEAVDMLPSIGRLKPKSRKALTNILNNPKKAEKVLDLMEAVVEDEKCEEQS